MPYASQLQTNFTAGEISPRLFGRVDIEKYGAGAASIENMVVLPHGGLARRPGTHFADAVKFPDRFSRLIPLELSPTLAYVLQFGNGYIRFHTDHSTAIDGRDFANGGFDEGIEAWTDASEGTGTLTHDPANGRLNLVGAGPGNAARAEQSFAAVSVLPYTINVDVFDGAVTVKVGSVSGGNDIADDILPAGLGRVLTFQSTVSRTVYVTFENAGNDTWQIDNVGLSSPIYEIDSPYVEADLERIKFAQTSTALYLAHPDWAPRRLRRLAVNEWVLEVLDFVDGPYRDPNKDETTLTPAAVSGPSVTLTASADVCAQSDDGRLVRLDNAAADADWGWGIINGVTDARTVTVNVREPFAGTTATSKWRLGAWSDTTGWPAAVAFFEQRLVFANTDTEPDRFWMSKTGTPEQERFAPSDFDGTVNDDNAITYQIADDQVNAIHWLAGGDVLVVGTATGEYVIRAGANQTVTPTNIQVKRQTTRGSDPYVRPVRIDQQLLHLQRAGRKLRNFFFDFDVNGYVSDDIGIVAEHITRGRVFDLAYQQEPDSIVWAARGDGALLGLTYQRDQQVIGWHRHRLGGLLGAAPAQVESIAVIPTPDNAADELWLVVARTVDGQTRRYVEYLGQPFAAGETPQDEAFFVDSGLTYNGDPAQMFAGLDHLEGETVSVLADGAVHPDVTVSGGQIALTRPAGKVQAGLPYVSAVRMLSPESGGGPGPAAGKTKRIAELILEFYETLGARYGAEETTLDVIPFRAGGDPMDLPPPIFTGFKKVLFPRGYGRRIEPVVSQDQPLPLTLLTATFTLQTNE
ncbi:MAG: hypothetical protein HKM95_08015 [Inquilinus sp.]|nr:hypothetical protein [Inquilinus sp.]